MALGRPAKVVFERAVTRTQKRTASVWILPIRGFESTIATNRPALRANAMPCASTESYDELQDRSLVGFAQRSHRKQNSVNRRGRTSPLRNNPVETLDHLPVALYPLSILFSLTTSGIRR
jgi:hypothetical protein